MRRYSLTYFIGQSIKGLWRNGVMSFASITVLMSCLVVMGSFALLVYNINYNLEELGLMNEIVTFIDGETPEEEVILIGQKIELLDNIQKVVYTSKEAGLEQLELDFPYLLKSLKGSNPLPYKYTITYSDNSQVPTLQYNLTQIEGIYRVNCQIETANNIENIKDGVSLIFIWFLAILFVVTLFVIINTIKLAVFSRRHEISIMRYVGATNWFVVLPFIFEGIIIGLLASGLAYLIQWYMYIYVNETMLSAYSIISIIPFNEMSMKILVSFIGVGILTGIIGSCISLRKYLKA